MNEPLLRVRSLTKIFAGTQALAGIDIDVSRGRVLAVVGENGAGKSTLGRVLAGEVIPDKCSFTFEGIETVIRNPKDARRCGIFLVHQEPSLCENLTIAANLFLGVEPQTLGFIDHTRIGRESMRICALVRLNRDPGVLVSELSIAECQKVEIGRALVGDPQLLVLDEPTSSLESGDIAQLISLLKQLRAAGLAVIYVTHKFWELADFADDIAVLRDGRVVAFGCAADMSESRIVSAMSRDTARDAPGKHEIDISVTDIVFRALQVRTTAFPDASVSIELRRGEIVGLTGPEGGGRSALLQTLFGLSRRIGGDVVVSGESVPPDEPCCAVRHGIALVPNDRRRQGVVMELSVGDNLLLPRLPRGHMVTFDDTSDRTYVTGLIREFAITPSDVGYLVGQLSGGNQQKVVLAKWLGLDPIVLLLDNPTRGVDITTRQHFYDLLHRLSCRGVAVLFTSSEPIEMRAIADRVLLMSNGSIRSEMRRGESSGLQNYSDQELVGG